ncbi:MAG: tRNA threonylcarbamoyladenosine dehydratase [Desulfopila sp.]|jgi:tRNA A37 threonylcarbamoyladenosine dehydratase|nr:tRNA threonylcarbamoyladenosine dehydratase [Desulfopila sp.]
MERFTRIIQLIGNNRFTRLQKSTVTIVGLGAVGGHATECLARAGVGNLRLVDFDTIQPSNINRQILALTTNIGTLKVEAGRRRILAINPECSVDILPIFAAEETMPQIISPAPDLLIDAIDSLNPKIQLLTAAYSAGIPIISSMGAALRTDPTKIRYGDVFESSNCPLAKHVRKRLRRRGIESGIPCVFSTEKVDFDYMLSDSEDNATPFALRGRKRNILGSLPTLTGIFGLFIANQAILQLTSDK